MNNVDSLSCHCKTKQDENKTKRILLQNKTFLIRKSRTGTYINVFQSVTLVSRLVAAASFSLANSLTSADVLSASRERYKNIFSKVSFNISLQQKQTWKLKTFFCEKNQW